MIHEPLHPGEILRAVYIEPLSISITEIAHKLGITRNSLSQLLNGKRGISMEMAFRLSKAFDTSVELWLGIQQEYDVWQAKSRINVDDVQPIYNSQPSSIQTT